MKTSHHIVTLGFAAIALLAVAFPRLGAGGRLQDAAGRVHVVGSTSKIGPLELERETMAALGKMEGRLGYGLGRLTLKVTVCDNDPEYRAAGAPGNTDACFIPPDRLVLRDAGELRQDLAHEISHALLRQVSDARCPPWLEEGIVNHETRVTAAGQYTPDMLARIGKALDATVASGEPWNLVGLRDSARESFEVSDAFYGAAWSATDYLYRVYGRETVLRSLQLMARHGTVRGFRKAFDRTPDQVEADWKATLETGRQSSSQG